MSERPFSVKSFRDFLAENRIMGSMCKSCGKVHLPPRPICPDCGGLDLEWTELRGEGTIEAYTVIHVPLSGMKGRCPYCSAIVKLDEGPSISGLVLGFNDRGGVGIGSRVTAELVKEGELTKLCFKLSVP